MGNWVTTLIETQLKDNEEGLKKKKKARRRNYFQGAHRKRDVGEDTRD